MSKQILNGVTYGKPRDIRELTQAQYDALSNAEKMNGVLYCIKDSGIVEGEQFAPIIYSLEEREIGTWVDGKPLYQKTFITNFAFSSTSGSITRDYNIDVTNLSIENVASVCGWWRRKVPNSTITILYAWSSQENNYGRSHIRIDTRTNSNDTIVLSITSDGTDYQNITLQYTKTTDTPGSGKWAQDGVPSHHYSTSEKVIGTWFGETLYEKTLQFTLDSTATGNWVSFNHGISNIDKIVNASSFAANDNGIYYNAIRFVNYSSYSSYVQAGGSFSLVAASRVDVGFQIGSDIPSSYNKIYVTIQYTKSS